MADKLSSLKVNYTKQTQGAFFELFRTIVENWKNVTQYIENNKIEYNKETAYKYINAIEDVYYALMNDTEHKCAPDMNKINAYIINANNYFTSALDTSDKKDQYDIVKFKRYMEENAVAFAASKDAYMTLLGGENVQHDIEDDELNIKNTNTEHEVENYSAENMIIFGENQPSIAELEAIDNLKNDNLNGRENEFSVENYTEQPVDRFLSKDSNLKGFSKIDNSEIILTALMGRSNSNYYKNLLNDVKTLKNTVKDLDVKKPDYDAVLKAIQNVKTSAKTYTEFAEHDRLWFSRVSIRKKKIYATHKLEEYMDRLEKQITGYKKGIFIDDANEKSIEEAMNEGEGVEAGEASDKESLYAIIYDTKNISMMFGVDACTDEAEHMSTQGQPGFVRMRCKDIIKKYTVKGYDEDHFEVKNPDDPQAIADMTNAVSMAIGSYITQNQFHIDEEHNKVISRMVLECVLQDNRKNNRVTMLERLVKAGKTSKAQELLKGLDTYKNLFNKTQYEIVTILTGGYKGIYTAKFTNDINKEIAQKIKLVGAIKSKENNKEKLDVNKGFADEEKKNVSIVKNEEVPVK